MIFESKIQTLSPPPEMGILPDDLRSRGTGKKKKKTHTNTHTTTFRRRFRSTTERCVRQNTQAKLGGSSLVLLCLGFCAIVTSVFKNAHKLRKNTTTAQILTTNQMEEASFSSGNSLILQWNKTCSSFSPAWKKIEPKACISAWKWKAYHTVSKRR